MGQSFAEAKKSLQFWSAMYKPVYIKAEEASRLYRLWFGRGYYGREGPKDDDALRDPPTRPNYGTMLSTNTRSGSSSGRTSIGVQTGNVSGPIKPWTRWPGA